MAVIKGEDGGVLQQTTPRDKNSIIPRAFIDQPQRH